MKVKFWGVRGSIPSPGPNYTKFGGNTTCIEVLTSEGRIIIDAGTGARPLGDEILSEGDSSSRNINFLITHTHWDHIQGFPFFQPIFESASDPKKARKISIYGRASTGSDLRQAFANQMNNTYFPVLMRNIAANLKFHDIEPGNSFNIGKVQIKTALLNHPGGVLGYRIEDNGKVIAIATDYEHPEDGQKDENLEYIGKDSDILIYDAQYTCNEYNGSPETGESSKKGFGHSTPSKGVEAAKELNTKMLVLTHHSPSHDDKMLAAMETNIKKRFNSCFAKEGLVIEI